MTDNSRLWTPAFVLLSLASVCTSYVFFAMTTATATIATSLFGATTAQAGLATGLFLIGAVGARATAAPIAERFGLRATLLASVAWYALTSASYLITGDLWQLMALRLLNGFGFGFVSTFLASAALGQVSRFRRGEASGWFTAGMAIGTAFGPLTSLTLLRVTDGDLLVRYVVAVTGVLGLLLVLSTARRLTGRNVPAPAPHPDNATATPAATLLTRIVEPSVLPIALVVALAAIAFSVVLTYLNEFTAGSHLERAAGFYFLVYSIAMLITRPPMGRLQDRRGNNVVIIPALISLIAGVSLTAIAQSGLVLLAGAILMGSGYGTLISSGQAMALNLADPSRATVAIASFFLLVDLGTGLGPSLLGVFFELVGYRGIFGIGAATATAGLLLFLLMIGRGRQLSLRRG